MTKHCYMPTRARADMHGTCGTPRSIAVRERVNYREFGVTL
jgi:hypothetical protein